MANVDTIDITKLIMVEQGSTPSNPASGKQKLFVRSSDHVLCLVDSSGTVTAFGAPSLTNPMSGAGDMIRGGTGGTPTRLAAGTSGQILKSQGAAAPVWAEPYPYVLLRDEETQNTPGGTFASGAWRTRTLNTKRADTGSMCTLSSNQFTLPAGSYRVRALAPCYKSGRNQLRIQNVTDNTTAALGHSCFNDTVDGNSSPTELIDRFTIAGTKTFELQHRCETTQGTNGLGVESNFTTEVYATIEIWQEPA